MTGAFFMRVDTHIWVLSSILLFLTAFGAEFGTYGFRWYLVRMYCALSGVQILYEQYPRYSSMTAGYHFLFGGVVNIT